MLEETCNIIKSITGGLDRIFTNENIAICVLTLCLIYAGLWINKFIDRVVPVLTSIKDALNEVKNSVNILNVRLEHHEDSDVKHDKKR